MATLPWLSTENKVVVAKAAVDEPMAKAVVFTETFNVEEVAFVVVLLSAVKFCKVEEPRTRRLFRVPRPPVNAVAKRFVVEAVVKVPLVLKRFVVVAEVPVA